MVCNAGLDSVRLREEVTRLTNMIVASDACSLIATDPVTGLFTHGWVEGIPDSLARSLITVLHEHELADHLELAHSPHTTTPRNSEIVLRSLRVEGFEHRARTALSVLDEVWGGWNVYRRGNRPFSERELCFLESSAPHVARGMRAAAGLRSPGRAAKIPPVAAPGVLVLDGCGQISLRTRSAAAHLEDLATIGVSRDLLPYAVMSVLTGLGSPGCGSSSSASQILRAQGASGEWYTLRASAAEPDCHGTRAAVIVIEPTSRSRDSGWPCQLHPFTPREREVVRLALEGLSTKQIAARLRLSPYTVQDHLANACGKVGVRGRQALLATLYGAGYRAEAAPSPLVGTR
jgi:DNA-binding CsgD family transcriptional regulator